MTPITVFTPAYNRADLLPRCFESMKRQTNPNFIWMIIDDGSTDGTGALVERWKQEPLDFELRYYYKENGGLYTAYNEAIARIDTPLCVCIDSDDYMPDDAIEKILNFWEAHGSDRVAGIVGLDCCPDGRVIGDRLPEQETVNLIDLLVGRYPIFNGDRTNVVRTELYRKFAPMEVFPGEKHFNPHYLHLQISQEYDFLVMNENLRFVEYQPDGMTGNIMKQYLRSPRSFAETRRLYLTFPDTSLKFRAKNTIHLVSSCLLSGEPGKAFRYSRQKWLTAAAYPAGMLLTAYIWWKARR